MLHHLQIYILTSVLMISTALACTEKGREDLTEGLIEFHNLNASNLPPELKVLGKKIKKTHKENKRLKAKLAQSEEVIEIRKEMQKRITQEEIYNRDRSLDLLERCKKELNMHPSDIKKMMDRDDPRISVIWKKMVKEEEQRLYNQIKEERIKKDNK